MKAHVLVIDDERHTADTIALFLQQEGFHCMTAYDGDSGLLYLLHNPVDVIVLDWMLPGLSGLEICKVAKLAREVKVIMLSARTSVKDKVEGLEQGGDDYLGKPFSLRELGARIRVLLRQPIKEPADTPGGWGKPLQVQLEKGMLEINYADNTARFNGAQLPLTLIEFRILWLMSERTQQVVTHQDICLAIWGQATNDVLHKTTVHVSKLRKKWLQIAGSCPIKSIYGIGYKLEGEPKKPWGEQQW